MKYYARYSNDGALLAIGIGIGGTEITEAEYNQLRTEMREKIALVAKLRESDIASDDIPEEWREEITQKVADIEAQEAEAEATAEATEADYLAALTALGVIANA